ncbi:MAG: histone deacetylase [candidate division Zixibacteria bacterium]|nr:histone deacetylase [candidate division Zixibacteria bacterium]
MSTTGLVYHPDYLKHDTGKFHPENASRLSYLMEHLEKNKILSLVEQIMPLNPPLEWVEKIHPREYIRLIEDFSGHAPARLDADTVISSETYRVALLSVGGVIAGVDGVMQGRVKNAFCAVRPPGHHAEPGRGMGFCIFNNVAAGARYVQEKYRLKKVLIADWDAHHGNGTQKVFYSDPTVYYFSIHQFPFYPGSGKESEEGEGDGFGYTLNIPMFAGSGDLEYIEVFETIFYPAALKFAPEFIFISAGFDAHMDDPLTDLQISSNGFREMTQVIKRLAEETCEGRIVSVLEGGYNPKALASSVEAHLMTLMGNKSR